MKLRYFDLHCDTATALYDNGETLSDSSCQLSSGDTSTFSSYAQVYAVFSKPGLSDNECYERFFKVVNSFKYMNGISSFASCGDDMPSHILSVEDGRLLAGDLTRLEALFNAGVRILTPLWGGSTCIGGSYDTEDGLTDLGREAVSWCFKHGIIQDVSHASFASADEILDISAVYGSPVIASHSDSYEVNPHPRNLTLDRAMKIKRSGGIAGICLHGPHLGNDPDLETIFRHVDYYAEHIGPDFVALGCDFDGTRELPDGIEGCADVTKIAETMSKHGYSEETIDCIFYKNAYNFFKTHLGKPGKENQ